MSNIDKAGEVLEGYFPPCENCRGLPDLEVGQCQDCAESVVHIARDLADAGLLAPDLPAKDEWDEVVLIPREGKTTVVKDTFTDTSYSITGARMHALDLLAAADHAEKEEA